MNRNKLIVIIIIILVCIGLGLGLGLGLKINSNVKSSNSPNYSTYPTHSIEIWTPAMCNEYITTCQSNINKGFVPSSSMDGCIEMGKIHQCNL